jgi:hypothetical protein
MSAYGPDDSGGTFNNKQPVPAILQKCQFLVKGQNNFKEG